MSGIYKVLKRVFKYSIYQYFSDIEVIQSDTIPADKPIIFIPNHRSAFMDPIVVACLLPHEMNFLARGESFQKPLMAKVFSKLNMIPIYRKEYSPTDTHKNDEVFQHCYNLLKRNGSLMIFPEGLSQTKFHLAPLKTGTARIALGAEAQNDFSLDVQIVPVGINYTHPHIFRSRLVLDIGKPIAVRDYRERYRSKPEETIKELTTEMEDRLRSKVVTLNSNSDDELIRQMEQLYASDPELSMDSWYDQRQFIASGIDYYRTNKEPELNDFTTRLRDHLRMYAILQPDSKLGIDVKAQLAIEGNIWKTIALIFTFPGFILGCITHLAPYLLTRFTASRIVKRSDFAGSVVLALGVLFFSLFLFAESYIVHQLAGNWLITTAFILIWPSLGIFSYLYGVTAQVYLRKLRILSSSRLRAKQKSLNEERHELIAEIKKAVEDYKSSRNQTATSS